MAAERAATLLDYIIGGHGSRRVDAVGVPRATLVTAIDVAAAANASPILALVEASRGATSGTAIAGVSSTVVLDENVLFELGSKCSYPQMCIEALSGAGEKVDVLYSRAALAGDVAVSSTFSMLGEYASRTNTLVAAASGECILVAGRGSARLRCTGRPSPADIEALAQLVSYILELSDEPPRSGVTALIVDLGGSRPTATVLLEDGRVVDGVTLDWETLARIEFAYSARELRSLADRVARRVERTG